MPGQVMGIIAAVEYTESDFEAARQNKAMAEIVNLRHETFGYLRQMIKNGSEMSFPLIQAKNAEEAIRAGQPHIGIVCDFRIVITAYGEQVHAMVRERTGETLLTFHVEPIIGVEKGVNGQYTVMGIFGFYARPIEPRDRNISDALRLHDPLPGAFTYTSYHDEKPAVVDSQWKEKVKINVAPEQALEVIENRSNGAISYTLDKVNKTVSDIDIAGELCLDELEATFAYLLMYCEKPVLVGDFIDDAVKNSVELRRITPTHQLFEQVDERHGITPSDALVFRSHNPNNELLIEGMAASKGGRVWIDKCTSLAALQSLIVELTYYCVRRDYAPTHVEQVVEAENELGAEQGEAAVEPVQPEVQPSAAPEKPAKRAKLYVLYHADSDGRFAGYCAWEYYNSRRMYPSEDMHFIEVQYGQDFPVDITSLRKSDAVFILDFSYKREILENVAKTGCFLKVLDHHKSAQKELESLDYAHFDMTKSGALLAWEYFFPNSQVPMVCTLVNDRDLWAKQYPQSRALESYLRSARVGSNWEMWQRLTYNSGGAFDKAIAEGTIAVQVEDSIINKVFKSKRHSCSVLAHGKNVGLEDRPYKYVIYNCPGVLHSEVAEKYYTELDVDLTIGWRLIEDNKMLFSLRSPNRCDVSKIATLFGGGGHASAAGFSLPVAEGFQFVAKYHK